MPRKPKSPARELISRAELARRAGVSKAAITKVCKGRLAAACVADRIDAGHATVVAYLASKTLPREAEKAAPASEAVPIEERTGLEGIGTYADLTLRQIVEQFGSDRRFKDWLDALKKIEDIRRARLDNDETEGTLISRDLVKTHVFGAIDSGNRRLLTDMPRTATQRLYTAARSDTPIEQGERILRDMISAQLKPVKAAAIRVLKSA